MRRFIISSLIIIVAVLSARAAGEHFDNGFVDYKYQSNVLVFTEDVEQYVITLDTLTKTLYMADYTPDDYLPSEGMVLAGLASEKMAEGLHHKVVSRAKVGSQYVIALEEATLQEIFEHLTLRLGSDTDDLTADSLGADESRLITRGDDNSGDNEKEDCFFHTCAFGIFMPRGLRR